MAKRLQDRERLCRDTNGREIEPPSFLQKHPADRRMEMHVFMGVGMIETQPCGREGCILSGNLGAQLTTDMWEKVVSNAEPGLVRRELAILIR